MKNKMVLFLLFVLIAGASRGIRAEEGSLLAKKGVRILNSFEAEKLKGIRGKIETGDATHGNNALVFTVRHSKYLTKTALISKRRKVGTIISTYGVYRTYYPEDWSEYSKLRLDIKSPDKPFQLGILLEDSIVSPHLKQIYAIPAGTWVTVGYDLEEAIKVRDIKPDTTDKEVLKKETIKAALLNTKKMCGIWIRIEERDGGGTIKLDNIRLVTKDVEQDETKLPVIGAKQPFRMPSRLLASTPEPREKLTCILNKEPVQWESPVEIPVKGGASYGLRIFDIAPVDNDRMLMAVDTTTVLKTVDAGKSWTGLDGKPNIPTKVVSHNLNAPGRWSAAMGPDIMVLGTAKCSGRATPVDSYSHLTAFNGKDWEVQPRGLVDMDCRHCPEQRVRLVRLDNGRIWTCWTNENRLFKFAFHARYSDDAGQTWRDAASNGLIELTTRGKRNQYCVTLWQKEPAMESWVPEQALGQVGPISGGSRHGHLAIAGWGEQVVCAYMHKEKLVCSFFDGTKWSKPKPAGVEGEPASMVHYKGETVFLATSAAKVYRLEGTKWVEDTPPGGTGKGRFKYPGGDKTKLSVAGKKLVAAWSNDRKISCSIRSDNTGWREPREIFSEQKDIHWMGMPVKSVDNFVPLVWTTGTYKQPGIARFVRIPVK